jgi:triacylglycerol lipase
MAHRIARLVACLALSAALAPAIADARSSSEPALTIPTATLRQAMHCKGKLAGAAHDPVLLVHGTFGWGAINWGWNYQKVLPTKGWPACTVDLPEHGAGDIQRASQYVVYAVRNMATRSRRKVALVGHSQGGLEIRWALRWWPGLRPLVSDVITLAAPNGGALYTNVHCGTPNSCAASLYQMRSDSNFLKALNRGAARGAVAGIPFTAISTADDNVFVTPSEAGLRGAVNIRVQDLCPAHHVDHVSLAFDGPAYAIALDALRHPGAARLSRINRAVCQTDTMPGVTRAEANQMLAEYNTILAKALGPNGARAESEPPLLCYVTGRCGPRGRS